MGGANRRDLSLCEDVWAEAARCVPSSSVTIHSGHEAVLLFFVLSGFVLCFLIKGGRQPHYSMYLLRGICRI